MTNVARLALAVSILAVLLSATVWLSFLGAPLGLVGLGLGLWAIRGARTRGTRSGMGLAAVVLSALAVVALPFFLVACNEGLSCV